MKTKDLIELLQKNDPSGESHVRISGDPIYAVERKSGYWDGPYNYLDKNEKGELLWVESVEGTKIDIHTLDIYTLVQIHKGNEEKIREHIIFKLNDEKHIESFLDNVKKLCEDYKERKRFLFYLCVKKLKPIIVMMHIILKDLQKKMNSVLIHIMEKHGDIQIKTQEVV